MNDETPQTATKMLRVRMTPDEWDAFNARADQAGMRMSEYARGLLLGTDARCVSGRRCLEIDGP